MTAFIHSKFVLNLSVKELKIVLQVTNKTETSQPKKQKEKENKEGVL